MTTELYQRLPYPGIPSMKLAATPAQVWMIGVLEIQVEHHGRSALVAQLSSYALRDPLRTDAHDEGYWAPPFVAHPVPIEYSPPTSMASLARMCSAIPDDSLLRDMNQLCYRLGLRDVFLNERSSFVEIKVSPRSPGLIKAYIFRRFGLVSVGEECLANLGDREGLMGLCFIPLEETAFHQRWSAPHERTEYWYRGKPIQSNLQAVIQNEDFLNELKSDAISLDDSDMVREESGILVSYDIGQFGKSQLHAGRATVLGTATEASRRFTEDITEIVADFASALGTMEFQTAGDGFLAGMPDRHGYSIEDRFDIIVKAWEIACGSLDNLVDKCADDDVRLGSRLSIHYGSYLFGRTASLNSVSPGFGGSCVVQAARYELALSNYIRARNSDDSNHWVVVSKDLEMVSHGAFTCSASSVSKDAISLAAKEFVGTGFIYHRKAC